MRAPDPVECEQVLIAWSSLNLLGNSGMGPVAASPGWRLAANDPFGGLGVGGQFLTERANALIREGVMPPVALEYHPTVSGALLIAKTYAASSRRGGQYQVHALRVDTDQCSPWDMWSARDNRILITDELTVEPSQTMPRLRLVRCRPDAPSQDTGALGLLLERLRQRRLFTIRSKNQPAAEALVRGLLAWLPVGMTRGVPISTLVSHPSAMSHGVGIVVPPFSQGFDLVDVDLDAGVLSHVGHEAAELGAALLCADPRELEAMSSVAELASWMLLSQTAVGELTLVQLHEACSDALFPMLLQRLARDAHRGPDLMRIKNDPEACRAFSVSLRPLAAEYSDVVAPLFASASGVSAEDHAHLQDWLLESVGVEQFHRYVLRSLVLETSSQPVDVDSVALTQILERALRGSPQLGDFDFRSTTPTWTTLTDLQIRAHLLVGHDIPSQARSLMRSSPGKLARVIDELVEIDPQDPQPYEGLLRWPDDDIDTLVAALLSSRRLDRSWAVRVMEHKPPPVVREVLSAHWPRIASHLGVPQAVAQHLVVKPKRWWERK